MNEGVSVITATGDRPVGLTLLVSYLARQTYKGPLEWVVVDDGEKPFIPDVEVLKERFSPFSLKYVRRAEPGVLGGSLQRNMIVALRNITRDNVICMEDDDWYREDYIQTMCQYLEEAPIVGEDQAQYYNVTSRLWRSMGNTGHASLCQTAWKATENALVDKCCRHKSFLIDVRIWGQAKNKKLFKATGMSVGIKGTPGRSGLTRGHRPDPNKYKQDYALTRLEALVGKDYHIFAPMYTHHIPSWWEWFKEQSKEDWVIAGKGPSFRSDAEGQVLALNTACLHLSSPPKVAHMVDLDVLEHTAEWLRNVDTMLVLPWHPHEQFKPTKAPLPVLVQDARYAVLEELRQQGRLLHYHASHHQKITKAPSDSPVVPLKFFSSEAAFGLLAKGGVVQISSCGVDGGKKYAPVFTGKPLANGQRNFDIQEKVIRRTLREHAVEWIKL